MIFRSFSSREHFPKPLCQADHFSGAFLLTQGNSSIQKRIYTVTLDVSWWRYKREIWGKRLIELWILEHDPSEHSEEERYLPFSVEASRKPLPRMYADSSEWCVCGCHLSFVFLFGFCGARNETQLHPRSASAVPLYPSPEIRSFKL